MNKPTFSIVLPVFNNLELFRRRWADFSWREPGGECLADVQARNIAALNDVLDAAPGGDAGAAAITERAVETMANALKTVVYLIDPARIVLYGPIFDHPYFLSRLKAEMAIGVDAAHAVPMEKSRFNNALENKAAGLLAVAQFMEHGGLWE